MGFREVSLAFDFVDGLAPAPKLVLVALADRADKNGRAWPSVSELQRRTCLSRATVFRRLKELENLGIIQIQQRHRTYADLGSRQTSSMYILDLAGMQSGKYRTSNPGSQNETLDKKTRSNPGAQNETLGARVSQKAGPGSHSETPMNNHLNNHPSPHPPAGVEEGAVPTGTSEEGDGLFSALSQLSTDQRQALLAALQKTEVPPQNSVPEIDVSLAREVLPDFFQAVPRRDLGKIATAIRQRLSAGWTKKQIHDALASRALPNNIHHLTSLVMARFRDDVPVTDPPPKTAGIGVLKAWSVETETGQTLRMSDIDWGAASIAWNEAKNTGKIPTTMTKQAFVATDPTRFHLAG